MNTCVKFLHTECKACGEVGKHITKDCNSPYIWSNSRKMAQLAAKG
jgi:hypothetical protein